MSTPLILIATTCYLLTAFDFFRRGNYSMSLVFISYAMANFGLIWSTYDRN